MVTKAPFPIYDTSKAPLLSEGWLHGWDFSVPPSNLLQGHGLDDIPGGVTPALANKLILSLTRKGDLVLDLAARSGSTLLEAMHLSRRPVGMEPYPLAADLARLKSLRPSKEDLLQLEQAITEFFTLLNQELAAKSLKKKKTSALLGSIMTRCTRTASDSAIRIFQKMTQNMFSGSFRSFGSPNSDNVASLENKMRQLLSILRENSAIPYKTFEPLVILADGRERQNLPFLYAPESRSGLADLVLTAPVLNGMAEFEDTNHGVFSMAPSLQYPWKVLSGQIAALERQGVHAAALRHLAKRVGSFYRRLQQYVENAAFYLRPNGMAAWVLAEHTVSQVDFPVLEALTEFSEAVGMKHFYTFEGINLISHGEVIYPSLKQYIAIFRKF